MSHEKTESEMLLLEAISNWRPDRPRRWLLKYGNWPVEGHSVLSQQYHAIRREANRLLKRPNAMSANGIASHALHLDQLSF